MYLCCHNYLVANFFLKCGIWSKGGSLVRLVQTSVRGMTRHGKNATAGPVYTYHEKKKDSATGSYGTQSMRLSKDSIKGFDCCSLSLQPCRNPVITPDGYLFEKEAILESLLHQKRENARKMKEYEKQKTKHENEQEELRRAEGKSKVAKFLSTEKSIVSQKQHGSSSSSGSHTGGKDSSKSRSALPSFWVPSLTPSAKPTEIKKPDSKTYCPMSGKQLRIKDLVSVKFTKITDGDKTAEIVKEARYMCPVTRDTLGNSIPCAVLRPTGDVITMDCVERIIRKNDMLCPISGKTLSDKDIIRIVRGGTGFAGAGVDLVATKAGAVMTA